MAVKNAYGDEVMTERTCRSCKWWKSYDRQYSGECHRHPPGVATETNRDGHVCSLTAWPATRESDTCGEHQPGQYPKLKASYDYIMDNNMNVVQYLKVGE